MNYIYALFDEKNPKEVPYVGCTQRPRARMREHLSGLNRNTKEWSKQAQSPVMKQLDKSKIRDVALRLEMLWIKRLKPRLNEKTGCALSIATKPVPVETVSALPIVADVELAKQVRLTPENYSALVKLKHECCRQRLSLAFFANDAIAQGIHFTRGFYTPKKK